MRIDKFLHCVRFYKTRSLASTACNNNAVKLSKQLIKPSKEIQIGDEIEVRRNSIWFTLKVIGIPKGRVGAKDVGLYILDKTPQFLIEEMKQRAKDQNQYREKGEGRPTKKDRRNLDDFFDDEFD